MIRKRMVQPSSSATPSCGNLSQWCDEASYALLCDQRAKSSFHFGIAIGFTKRMDMTLIGWCMMF